MATPGLSAVSNDAPEDRQDSSGVAVQPKYTKSASGALIPTASTVLSSPEEQGSILENMKNYVKQREAQQNSLLTALNLASIYGSGGAEGPWRALQAQEEQGQKTAAEIFNMKQAIAQQRGAQATQQEFMKSNISQGWLGMPTPTEGGAPATGGVQAGGSGAVTNFMCPAFLIPDTLVVSVGKGSTSSALVSSTDTTTSARLKETSPNSVSNSKEAYSAQATVKLGSVVKPDTE